MKDVIAGALALVVAVAGGAAAGGALVYKYEHKEVVAAPQSTVGVAPARPRNAEKPKVAGRRHHVRPADHSANALNREQLR